MQNFVSLALTALFLFRPEMSGAAGFGDETPPARSEVKGPLGDLLRRPDLKGVKLRLSFRESGKTTYRERDLDSPEDIKAFRAVMEDAKLILDPSKYEVDSGSFLKMRFPGKELAVDFYSPARYISLGSGPDRAYYEIKETKLRKLCDSKPTGGSPP